jgi:hypothetical protein
MSISPIQMPPDKVVQSFGEMADDYFIAIALHKSLHFTSLTLPFFHAHVLELSAKAACHKFRLSINLKDGHNLMGIYRILGKSVPGIENLMPTSSELHNYKKVWLRDNGTVQEITLPSPDELRRLELAYFVDNIKNLKYGFTKELVAISTTSLSTEYINNHFLSLYRCCRSQYANIEFNTRIKAELYRVFGNIPETNQRIYDWLEI